MIGFPGEVLACLDMFSAGMIAETWKRWVWSGGVERQMAVGFGDAEVFIHKYSSSMKTLVQKGLRPVRTFLSTVHPSSTRTCCPAVCLYGI